MRHQCASLTCLIFAAHHHRVAIFEQIDSKVTDTRLIGHIAIATVHLLPENYPGRIG